MTHLKELERLKELTNRLLKISREERHKVSRLEKENLALRHQIEQIGVLSDGVDSDYLDNLLTENERLKHKNLTVQNQLSTIVSNLERNLVRQKNGVDSY